MRLNFTIFSLLLLTCSANAQKLTGIWRGYFTSTPIVRDGFPEERYKYEIQIEQRSNNSVAGVTYSYKTTVFYGKAELTGILTLPAKSLILRETKLVDLKIADNSDPCLMTCYLDYTRIGKLEVLEGTFISTNAKNKRDCGTGKVYLEKVTESDFKKEDFLVKKKSSTARPDNATNNSGIIRLSPGISGSRGDNLAAKPPVVKPGTQRATPQANAGSRQQGSSKPTVKKPGDLAQRNAAVPKTQPATAQPKQEDKVPEQAPVTAPREQTVTTPQRFDNTPKRAPVPRALVERENNLVKTINITDPDVTIELYDNGTIDNDTITVYHNNQMVISKGKLSLTPLSVKLHCTPEDAVHELVIVADNLGDIPPNTAMMVIKVGKERQVGRYEVFLSSNERRNAKVILNYTPGN